MARKSLIALLYGAAALAALAKRHDGKRRDGEPLVSTGWSHAAKARARGKGVDITWESPWREMAIEKLAAGPVAPGHLDVYQFGVYTGGSLRILSNLWQRFNLPAPTSVWAFDSFQGLAAEQAGVSIDKGGAWRAGAFSAADAFGVYDSAEIKLQGIERGRVDAAG